MNRLSKKETQFCEAVAKGYSATKAYLMAYGGTYGAAGVQAHKLLKKAKIKDEVARAKLETIKQLGLSAADFLLDAVQLMKADIMDFYEQGEDGTLKIKDLSQVNTSLIESVRINKSGQASVKLRSKDAAIMRLAGFMKWTATPDITLNINHWLQSNKEAIERILAKQPDAALRELINHIERDAANE